MGPGSLCKPFGPRPQLSPHTSGKDLRLSLPLTGLQLPNKRPLEAKSAGGRAIQTR